MRKFIARALKKLPKLDRAQIHALIYDLASENEQLEVVLNSMGDGVVVADVENYVVFANKAAERVVPVAAGDWSDRLIWEYLQDEDIAEFVRETLVNQESVVDREFTLDSGSLTRILSCSIMPLVRNGQIQGSILRIEDISEKRGREARLRRAESLASLTTLAAGVAHEIKNPLGSIGIHIQLIQKALNGSEELDRDAIESNLKVINEEIDRLNKIVVDFLFAVRPMDMTLEERHLNSVVFDLLEFVEPELEEGGIRLDRDLESDLPMLKLDEKHFKQALLNIVKNAIAAMPDGGTLRVSTRLSGDFVVLRISDNGIGIHEDVLGKIFEPYFTTKDFGSGIGLTLVYKVIKEHMGEISVNSDEGKGTTFTITLPIPQKEQHLLSWKGEDDEV